MTLDDAFMNVVEKAQRYDRMGKERPAWLVKQINAVHTATEDFQRGVSMLIDGLQDELDALRTARYVSYKPGVQNG